MDIKNKLTVFGRKTKIKVEKHSPEILLGVGTVTFLGTIAMTVKQTLSADKILGEHQSMMSKIEQAAEISDDYKNDVDNQQSRDRMIAYTKTSVAMAKHYLPVVLLGSTSLVCFFWSNKILRRRYVGALASLTALTEVFDAYRKRVIEEEGVEKDRHYRFGTEKVMVDKEVTDAKGKTKTVQEEAENIKKENVLPSDDARIFDASNSNWDKNIDFSKMYLSATEKMANDMLVKNGSLFLNEVYDMLGFSRSDRGAVVGWIKGQGDGYVDFGFREPVNRRFINGEENVVLLDFNHQGVIIDKL